MSGHLHAPFFYLPAPVPPGGAAALAADDAEHLRRVRRAAPGDSIRLSDGRGWLGVAGIVSVGAAQIQVEVREEAFRPRPEPGVTVIQGIPRTSIADLVVTKLVELGVDCVGFFEAGRTAQRWSDQKKQRAARRWSGVGNAASKQSHRAWLPEIVGPLGLDEAAEMLGKVELKVVMDPAAKKPLREAIRRRFRSACVVLGPEGGLTGSEVGEFERSGATPATLGEQILRAETAAIAGAAAVMYEAGRLGG